MWGNGVENSVTSKGGEGTWKWRGNGTKEALKQRVQGTWSNQCHGMATQSIKLRLRGSSENITAQMSTQPWYGHSRHQAKK